MNSTDTNNRSFDDFHELVKTKINLALNHTLNSYLADTHKDLASAVKYAVLGNGNRLRPLAMALSATSLKMTMPIEAMQAIELIHSYSLVHDDLPALDNDKYRREKLSVHAKFGEAIAILTGDALIAMSFDVISDGDYKAINLLSLTKALAVASGPKALVDGQTRDLFPTASKPDLMPLLKTGALFAFATSAPCIYCGLKTDDIRFIALKKFGSLFGLAYQYYDDLKDNDTTSQILRPKIITILSDAKNCLEPWKNDSKDLINMCDFIKVDCQ